MSLTRQKILQIQITTSQKEKILEHIKKYLDSSFPRALKRAKKHIKPLVVFTPNPEQIVAAQKNPAFAKTLNWADVTLPDGIGLVWAGSMLAEKSKAGKQEKVGGRIAGVDFMDDLVGVAAKESVRIGLIGGFDGLAVEALECLRAKYPRLQGWAADGPEITADNSGLGEGPADFYWAGLVEKIATSGTQMVFVGLGAPKQEFAIERLAVACARKGTSFPLVIMAVGGSLDMIVGRLKRAPLFIRSIGFEWFWRLLQEPWRIQRQFSLITFVRLVIQAKLNKKG